ncbi:MAG TPA: tetratricopeptide repeat protein, partial [Bacillota bacterium]|nr:tetratricopeptide repeat protein [Bacillota bacterium]
IIVLVLAFVSMGVWTYYRWNMREPTITPEAAEIKYMQQMVAQNPKSVFYISALAYAFQKNGQIPQAREQYLKAIKLDPKDMGSLYNLGVLAQLEKKFPEAESYYKKTLQVSAKHYLANVGLAKVYLDTGKYDLSIQKADSLIKTQRQLVDPHLIKAIALEKKGKKAEAKIEYQTVLRFIANQPEALKGLERLK